MADKNNRSPLGLSLMIRSLNPLIDKNVTDDKLNRVFSELAETFPLQDDETRNICTITQERNGKVYFCIAGFNDYKQQITTIKKQWQFVAGLKYLLSNIIK